MREICYFLWVHISSERFLDFSQFKENLMALKIITSAFSNMALCNQIKNYLLTWWEKYNAYSKKSLVNGNMQCLFCRIMFNIDQEGSWKIMNHPRFANSAPYLGIKWPGITLGSRMTRDHQRDLRLFLYFFCKFDGDIPLHIWFCNTECLLFNALVLRSFE